MNEKEIAQNFIKMEFSKEMLNIILEQSDKKSDKIERILDYIIWKKVWNDTIIYERKIQDSPIISNKETICKNFKNMLNELKKDSDYDKWHEETLTKLAENYFYNKYGLAQKFLNMAIKHLFLVEIGYEIKLLQGVSLTNYKNYFDIPIDSYILYWFLYNSVGNQEIISKGEQITNWNNMGKDIYPFLQNQIKNALSKKYAGKGSILILETCVWTDIKEFKNKIRFLND